MAGYDSSLCQCMDPFQESLCIREIQSPSAFACLDFTGQTEDGGSKLESGCIRVRSTTWTMSEKPPIESKMPYCGPYADLAAENKAMESVDPNGTCQWKALNAENRQRLALL